MLCLATPTSALALQAARPKASKDPGKLFADAEAAYQAGRFQDAIDLLKEAQAIAPDPILLYNLARAYEALGELESARDAYESFIEADPNTTDRGAIEGRIRSLEGLIEERKKKAQPEPTDEPAKPIAIESTGPSPIPWIIAGVGAAGLGVGGVLGGLSLGASSDAEDPSTSGQAASELADDADSFALGANVAFGIGGAVALAGVIWGIVDLTSLPSSDAAKTALHVRVGPGGAELVVDF